MMIYRGEQSDSKGTVWHYVGRPGVRLANVMLYRHVSELVWQSAGILYNWGDLYWEALKSLGLESSPDSILTIFMGE